MALGPVRLDVNGLVGIVKGLLVFGLGSVDGGPVGVKDVVLGLDLEGLGEFLTIFSLASQTSKTVEGGVKHVHGSRVVLGREGLVAFSLQSVSHSGCKNAE